MHNKDALVTLEALEMLELNSNKIKKTTWNKSNLFILLIKRFILKWVVI